jgi:hypothetical protein
MKLDISRKAFEIIEYHHEFSVRIGVNEREQFPHRWPIHKVSTTGCFGTTPGASCSMLSPIEHFEAHLHAFQSMTTAVTQTFSLLAALLLSITALIFLFIQQIDNAPRGIPILPRGDDVINSQKSRITHWLTLHEKRDPSLFAGAVNN